MKQKERSQVEWVYSQAGSISDLIRLGKFTEAISRVAGIQGTLRQMLSQGSGLRPRKRRAAFNEKQVIER